MNPSEEKTELRTVDELTNEWIKGYVCAVANMLNQHGCDTIAKDCLNSIGPATVDWSMINPCDVETLKKYDLI